jgi:hypothetical protein
LSLSSVAAHARVGLDQASYYNTEPLRETLASLTDLAQRD